MPTHEELYAEVERIRQVGVEQRQKGCDDETDLKNRDAAHAAWTRYAAECRRVGVPREAVIIGDQTWAQPWVHYLILILRY